MNVVFLGPPGSGKGTQARRLVSSFELTHVSTGDVFRDAISKKSPLGQKIQDFVDKGKLVPDELVTEVVMERLKGLSAKIGFLLDGYPRTVEQAKSLDGFSEREKIAIDVIIFFDSEASLLVERLSSRRQCGQCKEVYNLITRPPKVADTCDLCQGKLNQRPDDAEEVVKERLDTYQKKTVPILDYYKDRSSFHRIDAAQDIERVYGEMVAIMQNYATRTLSR